MGSLIDGFEEEFVHYCSDVSYKPNGVIEYCYIAEDESSADRLGKLLGITPESEYDGELWYIVRIPKWQLILKINDLYAKRISPYWYSRARKQEEARRAKKRAELRKRKDRIIFRRKLLLRDCKALLRNDAYPNESVRLAKRMINYIRLVDKEVHFIKPKNNDYDY